MNRKHQLAAIREKLHSVSIGILIWVKAINKTTKAVRAFNKLCEELRKRGVVK